jgi:hypothetical protein
MLPLSPDEEAKAIVDAWNLKFPEPRSLMDTLSRTIQHEIDREIIKKLIRVAGCQPAR